MTQSKTNAPVVAEANGESWREQDRGSIIPRHADHLLKAAVIASLESVFAGRPREALAIAHDAGWRLGHHVDEATATRVLDQLVENGIAKVFDFEAVGEDGNPAPRYSVGIYTRYLPALRQATRLLDRHATGE